MNGSNTRHPLRMRGHQTSIRLEAPFWAALKKIAAERGLKVAEVVAEVNDRCAMGNLSSAVRVYTLNYYQMKVAAEESTPDTNDAVEEEVSPQHMNGNL